MKLRLQENSIRFRVSPEEVERLAAGERLEQAIALGPDERPSLSYSVIPEGDRLALEFSDGALRLMAPPSEIAAWAQGKALAIEETRNWDGGTLEIVLEKDLDRPRR